MFVFTTKLLRYYFAILHITKTVQWTRINGRIRCLQCGIKLWQVKSFLAF